MMNFLFAKNKTGLVKASNQETKIYISHVHDIGHNPIFHKRTKHEGMGCYFVRQSVETKDIVPIRIKTQDQFADLITKPLGSEHIKLLSGKLGIRNLHAPTLGGSNGIRILLLG